VTPIRPNTYAVQPPANPAADAARLQAQRAFFDAAMGRANGAAAAQAPLQTAPPQAAAPQAAALSAARAAPVPAPVQRAQILPDPSAPAPAKVLRPGSLLDIRV
jgi:hypothetical protein